MCNSIFFAMSISIRVFHLTFAGCKYNTLFSILQIFSQLFFIFRVIVYIILQLSFYYPMRIGIHTVYRMSVVMP